MAFPAANHHTLQCMMQFYCTSCIAMPPNGMETHVHHTTAPVDCQIEFLSFERLEMSSRAHIWLYPLHDQTTRKSTHLFNCGWYTASLASGVAVREDEVGVRVRGKVKRYQEKIISRRRRQKRPPTNPSLHAVRRCCKSAAAAHQSADRSSRSRHRAGSKPNPEPFKRN